MRPSFRDSALRLLSTHASDQVAAVRGELRVRRDALEISYDVFVRAPKLHVKVGEDSNSYALKSSAAEEDESGM